MIQLYSPLSSYFYSENVKVCWQVCQQFSTTERLCENGKSIALRYMDIFLFSSATQAVYSHADYFDRKTLM